MIFLLDSNTCILYLKGKSTSVKARLDSLSPDDIAVCSLVKAELFFGSQQSTTPEQSLAVQESFLDQFVSLPFDDKAARFYARIRAQLKKAGTPIGPNDLLIASIALANNLILVTHNSREFGRVPNLVLEDWELTQ